MKRSAVCVGLLLLLLGVVSPSAAQGDGTEVSGAITENTLWSLSGSPYRVVGDLSVEEGAKLTIEKSVVVIFERGVDSPLVVRGALDAHGNVREPVTFSCEAAFVGCWHGIEVFPSAAPQPVLLDHVELEFADPGVVLHPGVTGFLSDTLFRFNSDAVTATPGSHVDRNVVYLNTGVGVRNPGLGFKRNVVTQNGVAGVELLQEAYTETPRFSDNSLFRNGRRGARIDLRAVASGDEWAVDASDNYWGTTDHGTISAHIIDGNDEPGNSAAVRFDPFMLEPHAQLIPIPARPTWARVGIATDRSIRYGDRIQVTPEVKDQTFRSCDAEEGGARLVASARPADGDGKKVVLGEGRSGSTIRSTESLRENSIVRVRLVHDILYCRTEAFTRVEVAPRLSFDAPDRAAGSSFLVRGKIAPVHARGITIQQRIGGRWEPVAKAEVAADGRFRASISAAGRDVVLRARFKGDRDHAATVSATRRVRA